MSNQLSVSSADVANHLRYLVEQIGPRLAGSEGERKAAAYIAEVGARCGAVVHEESFPVRERAVSHEHLQIQVNGVWQTFPCSLFSSTPGTDGKSIEAPLVFFEAPAETRRPNLHHLTGKGVVHLGTHIESREQYRRLIEARPAFLMFVDIRYPGNVPLADGMFPEYTRAIGAVPTVNVAYQDAWNWKIANATHAKLTVHGGPRPSTSSNVVLELPGETEEFLLVGGHHDTQANSVGADDNGTGVVSILELARVLAPQPRRRGIRLISFGAEEQLSVGSAAYVRRHRADLQVNGCLMWNVDSIGSAMGWTELVVNGTTELSDWVATGLADCGDWTVPRTAIVPYSDHFPFVAAGVPSIWLYRQNCITGRFFHHRPDDDLSRIACDRVAHLLNSSAKLLTLLANAPELPFHRRVPPELAQQADAYWNDLFGGWGVHDTPR